MATVTYKRRMFPGKLLKARPMARSRVTTVTTEFVKIAETERNSEISQIFSDTFLPPHFFRKINSHLGTTQQAMCASTQHAGQSESEIQIKRPMPNAPISLRPGSVFFSWLALVLASF